MGQLFFLTDDTKIKGNKAYDQGNYYEALDIYEQVLGCYLWLAFVDEELKDRLFSDFQFKGLTDKDVDMKERPVMREEDREFETETSNTSPSK